MGLFDGIKAAVARSVARAQGEKFAKQKGNPMLDWLKRNKVLVGSIFAAIATWGAVQGCPPVVTIDVLAVLHISCATANTIIGVLGAFLGGAGLVTSDKHEAVIQGVRPPTGPPPAEAPKA